MIHKTIILFIALSSSLLLFLFSSNSPVIASNCTVTLNNFRLYKMNINNQRSPLDYATSYYGAPLVNSKELKNSNLTAWIFANQTGCDDEWSRWVTAYKWNEAARYPLSCDPNIPGSCIYTPSTLYERGCDPSTEFDCIHYGYTGRTYTGTFPTSGNPVYTDFSVGPSGLYMARGAAYGYGKDDSWSWSWSQGLMFLYEQVNDLSIDSRGHLTGSVTLPWYDTVAGPNNSLPSYSLLLNTDPSTVTNQSVDDTEIPIYPISGNYVGSPDWHFDNVFDANISGLIPGQTYYWRIRQQGSQLGTYIPGGSFTASGLTTNSDTGFIPFTTTLTAYSGTTTTQAPLTYYFWKHCPLYADFLASFISQCGNPDTTISNTSNNTQTVTFTYSSEGTYSPAVVIVPANGSLVSALTTVTTRKPFVIKPYGSASGVFQNKMWLFGGFISPTLTASSNNGMDWNSKELTLRIRKSHSVIFTDPTDNISKMWLIGDIDSTAFGTSDYTIYSSPNGEDWTLRKTIPLYYSGMPVVFNNQIWLIAGGTSAGITNKVIASVNGVDWTAKANFPIKLWLYSAVVFNSKMYVLGGKDINNQPIDQIFSSADGNSWTPEGRLPVAMYDLYSVVFNNKLWVIGERTTTGRLVNNIYSSSDGSNWELTSHLPLPVDRSFVDVNFFTFTDPISSITKLWVLGYDQSRAYVFSSSDGIHWNSVFAPCTGTLSLTLSPTSALPSQDVSATASGLTNCMGSLIILSSGPNFTPAEKMGFCYSNGTSCQLYFPTQTVPLSYIYHFTAPSTVDTYRYYSTLDQNGNGIIDPEEIASATLTVTTAPPVIGGGGGGTGGGGGGGAGAISPSSPGCVDAGAQNRATGLVSTPSMSTESKFNTSGGCVQDPKAAFVPYKIPTFDDLKSLYYTQK